MQYQLARWFFVVCFLSTNILQAQSVLYSPIINNADDEVDTHFEVIGKAGNYYWAYRNKKKKGSVKEVRALSGRQDQFFEVYDARLNRVKEMLNPLSDSVLKQYLIPQSTCFDQLIFKKAQNKTAVVVNRFTQQGTEAVSNAHLFDYPAEIALEDVIITRSPDQKKILVLGFVRSDHIAPDLFARLYTREWELLDERVYNGDNLLQPVIQFERTEYVLESSDASPIKLTNAGDWLMVTTARLQNKYVICHFKQEDHSLAQTDLQQTQSGNIEYCSLSVNEEKDAYIGMLEDLGSSDRSVRMVQYNLAQGRIGYDTSYRFHLKDVFKNQERHVFEEAFIQIPGKGFMYLKEFGRRYFVDYYTGEEVMLDNEQEYTAYGNAKGRLKFTNNEYTRNSNLSDVKKRFERGDLSVKYFPFQPSDSSWAGLIHAEQNTELRYDDLSYACVPSRDKIIFLYNSLAMNEHRVSSSTVLDHKGQSIDEGVVFWRADQELDFQNARLIHPKELYVPFERDRGHGFAIIRF